ncbi:tRNA (adenosine(37)-N6)-threonylcarbamoyltransferase complex dimerization subunit type 1 TsaB [Sphingomonas sp. SUN039]|uniref:tRNA (adenosine(37)-N6)-threonylcarbamoyltransferase complex dimerization subunit type 1 TsaB n=1 Tax=Sphingomonas sp. SUN039 TaxID=2937787 RepID=UPI0021641699|nr:tRNA (adenosine(37)-N6)-threonylcarbamoyltransferase complex dimerization subunit type 1 TsaB [Sphingomonas sp. SUN039]UVO54769.1 tRNA (adenosine(37)-N6)-threonylcarbamoyltransferase complex dimerization subunit type 1 TsaB [Sphingomonas sp. SUN039]
MRLLAIETATSACSVALIEDGRVVASDHVVVGRGHAERLLPMIAALPDGGRGDAILVDVGPGSFTGIRVGVAAARALGFAWDVPVAGYASLALLAATDGGRADTVVAIEGGHGELFVGRYGGDPLREIDPVRSMPFDAAVSGICADRIIGNAAARLVAAGVRAQCLDIAPDARATILLPPGLAALPPVPLYGRGADAKPMIAT